MSDLIDARGLSCPQPVILTMKALAALPPTCEVMVDNPTARENVTRFAEHAGYRVSAIKESESYRLSLIKSSGTQR